ncbi:MAG: T9SS type A sorting domain-containing protein, partial [Bacteroidota bacterium]
NEDLQLVAFSTAIDAGDNSQNSSSEDAASNARNYDDTGVTDTGAGSAPIIDMGAFERQTDSEDNCPSDPITLTDPETGTTDYITQAEIISTQSIESGATVLYQAGTTITLSADFHAKSGSTFTARIEDCAAQNSTEETIEERSEEIDANKTALQVVVFPNPFNSITNIQFYLATAGDVVLTITDMNGKVVHQQQYLDLQSGEYQHQFEASQMPDGMYFLHIRTAQQQMVKQLIVQK